MYLEYYDLKEKPFAITPDPDFIYLNDTFRQGFNEIVYAVHNKLGLAVIIGEVGTGKTTLARAILKELRGRCKTAYIINPALSFEELVSAILRDLGETDLPEGREALLTKLNEFLLDAYEKGETVVVFIDEAHLLEEKELEKVRLLSNLETNKEKLLQIVLIGQPELGKTLSKRSMRQLRDRIVVQVGLEPFKPSEVCDYIYHRLSLAGDAGALTFTPRACKKIAQLSGGIPRRINLLCDRALLAAYAKRTFEVTPKLVKEAAKDINREFPQEIVRRERRGIGWSGWVLIFMVLCIAGVFYINQTFFGYSPKELLRELLSVGRSVPQVISSEEKGIPIKAPVSSKTEEDMPNTSKRGDQGQRLAGKKKSGKRLVKGTISTKGGKVSSDRQNPSRNAEKATKGRSLKESEETGKMVQNPAERPKSSKASEVVSKSKVRVKESKAPSSSKSEKMERVKARKIKHPSSAETNQKATSVGKSAKGKKSSKSDKSSPKVEKVGKKEKIEGPKKISSQEPKTTVQSRMAQSAPKSAVSSIDSSKQKKKRETGYVAQNEPILSPETERVIERRIEEWKSAMENLDEKALKAMYDPSLYPQLEDRLSLMEAGGEEREIRIENLRITPLVNGDVQATFEQQYLSMRYSDYGLTTLVFRKRGKRWVIVGYSWKSL